LLNFTPKQFNDKYEMLCMAHHMTSINNLHSIFAEGALLSHAALKLQNVNYDDLSMDEIQLRRAF